MTIDTSRAVEIEASVLKLIGISVGGLVLAALSVAIALHAFPNIQSGSSTEFYAYLGAPFFGAVTFLALWRALTSRGPVVTITREGIRDTRVATEYIPWSAIKDIGVWKHHRQRVLVLDVDPVVEAGLGLTRVVRWSRSANRALGVEGLCVTAVGLKIGFDELQATILAFADAWRSFGTNEGT
jgi:hypothetical protein